MISYKLTPGQRAVNKFLLLGFSNEEIAKSVDLTVKGVKFHISGILRASNSKSRLEHVAKHYLNVIEDMQHGIHV